MDFFFILVFGIPVEEFGLIIYICLFYYQPSAAVDLERAFY
jgi:hypothetical protein